MEMTLQWTLGPWHLERSVQATSPPRKGEAVGSCGVEADVEWVSWDVDGPLGVTVTVRLEKVAQPDVRDIVDLLNGGWRLLLDMGQRRAMTFAPEHTVAEGGLLFLTNAAALAAVTEWDEEREDD